MSEMVRIRFWVQDTIESGRWISTEPMTLKQAELVVDAYRYNSKRAIIIREGATDEQERTG